MTGSNRFLIISNIIIHRVYIYIPNILSKSNHYITYDSKMYHISNYTPSVPQLGHTFLGARDPKGLAASRSICRKTWKLRPLKPCRDLWEIYGKSMGNPRETMVFTGSYICLPPFWRLSCRSLVESKTFRIAKWLAKKSATATALQSSKQH